MLLEKNKTWLDYWVDLVLLLPRLFGRAWIVILSAVITYVMLTRGMHG